MTSYLVRAYTKTGIYSKIVTAADERAAFRRARPALRHMAFGRIVDWYVCAA